MKKYFVVDVATQAVINTVVWDSVSEYNVEQGCMLVEVTEQSIAQFANVVNE